MQRQGDGHYHPYRVQRIVNIRAVQHDVEQRIDPDFLRELIRFITEARLVLYGGIQYNIGDIVIAWLYYLMFASSFGRIQRLTNLPHSNMKQWFGAIRSVVYPWFQEYIRISTFPERVAAARHLQELPGLRNNTVVIDGIHIAVANRQENEGEVGYSFKLRRNARSFQAACDHTGRIIWMSCGFPANNHDISCLRSVFRDFTAATSFDTERETILADRIHRFSEGKHLCSNQKDKRKAITSK